MASHRIPIPTFVGSCSGENFRSIHYYDSARARRCLFNVLEAPKHVVVAYRDFCRSPAVGFRNDELEVRLYCSRVVAAAHVWFAFDEQADEIRGAGLPFRDDHWVWVDRSRYRLHSAVESGTPCNTFAIHQCCLSGLDAHRCIEMRIDVCMFLLVAKNL